MDKTSKVDRRTSLIWLETKRNGNPDGRNRASKDGYGKAQNVSTGGTGPYRAPMCYRAGEK